MMRLMVRRSQISLDGPIGACYYGEMSMGKQIEIPESKLLSLDPSGTKKYLKWIKAQASKGSSVEDLGPTIDYFHKNINRFENKDIYSYKELKDLEDKVKEISSTKSRSEVVSMARSQAIKIVDNDRWVVRRIDGKSACCHYGRDTKWCITMQDSNYFESYSKDNNIFYFLEDKSIEDIKSPKKKFAYLVQRDKKGKVVKTQVYNSHDSMVDTDIASAVDVDKKVISLIKKDIKTAPKPFLAKMNDDEVSTDQVDEAFFAEMDRVKDEVIIRRKNALKAGKSADSVKEPNGSFCETIAESGKLSQVAMLQIMLFHFKHVELENQKAGKPADPNMAELFKAVTEEIDNLSKDPKNGIVRDVDKYLGYIISES